MTAAGNLRALRATLAEPTYGRYVAGNSISLVGNWIQRTATAWIAWDLSQSAALLGLVAFCELFPALIVGPVGGVLADRHDRRKLIMRFQVAMFGVALALWLAEASGHLDTGWLLALVLLQGTLVGLNQPARLSIIPALVTHAHLGPAIAINSMVFNAARFVGPAVAGFLIASFGTAWTFLVNALTFLPFLWALSTLVPTERQQPLARGRFLTQIVDGLRYVLDAPALRVLFLLVIAGALLVRPLGELLPALADGIFGRGASGLAMLSASLGLGAIVGGLIVVSQDGGPSVMALAWWLAAGAVSVLAVASAPSFAVTMVLVGLTGICLVGSGVMAQTMMQMQVASELRGRVMSLFGLTMRAAPALGALALGSIADGLGIRMTLILANITFLVMLALAGIRWWRSRIGR